MVRLGGLRWGPELLRVGHPVGRDLRQERDAELCHGLADIIEVLHGAHIYMAHFGHLDSVIRDNQRIERIISTGTCKCFCT